MQLTCNICSMPVRSFGTTIVLNKYSVEYFRCTRCGFIQTETPYWLDEAYSTAIASLDVGVMQRNLTNADVVDAVLCTLIRNPKACVDFGAGHGIFVRLMRDRGFDFYWSDLHASNDYARGFEYSPDGRYDLLTAFEVVEHLVDPITELAPIMQRSDNVLISTGLVPYPVPALGDWWYFAPATGQHVSFFSSDALKLVAKRFDRHLLSNGFYHLFTREPKNATLFRAATNRASAWAISRLKRRKALTDQDCEYLLKRLKR